VSTEKPLPKWIEISATMAPDPRVSDKSKNQRYVLVTMSIDDEGLMWERVGRDPPVCLGRPPDRDPDQPND